MLVFGFKIGVRVLCRGILVWQPRAEFQSQLPPGSPNRDAAEKVAAKFLEVMDGAMFGNYIYTDNFARIDRALEQARVENLNPEKYPINN